MKASIEQAPILLRIRVTIITVLRTLRALPALIRAAASGYHFTAALCETETVIQAYIMRAAACAGSSTDSRGVTWDVKRRDRTVGIVTRLCIDYHDVA